MNSKEQLIRRTLLELSVSPSRKGYSYIVEAISAVVQDPSRLNSVCKGLYTDIARNHGVNSAAVERCIRIAVTASYTDMPLHMVDKVFGNTITPHRDMPTSKQYIAAVANYVRCILMREEGL